MWGKGPPTLRVHLVGAGGLVIGSFGPVHMVIYRATPTVEDLQRSDHFHQSLQKEYPDSTSLLTYIFHKLEMPSSDVRQLGAEMLRKVAPHIRCSATIVEGDGFMASAARAVLSGIQLLSRVPCPSRLFSTVDEASAWIGTYYEDRPIEGLPAAAAALREHRPAAELTPT